MPSSPQVVTLEFDPGKLQAGGADIRKGLSAVVLRSTDLWLACDEGCRLERLSRAGGPEPLFSGHAVFELADLINLPAGAEEEADVEGLDIDDDWLWLVGSHSVKRKKPKDADGPAEAAAKLEKTERDGNRHLLARVPIEGNALRRESGARRAGTIATSPKSSALLDAIVGRGDRHLKPFVEIPGKDNGLDIEGLCVRGPRVLVGLRGPVLREWCCILELRVEADADGALRLESVDQGVPYRKHFLKLGGLGVRDLVALGEDLLILAGPTMAHDGPIEVWRWRKGALGGDAGLSHETERLLAVPHGEGEDRAEGMTLFDRGGGSTNILVVFDTPAQARLMDPSSVRADVFPLP